MIELYPGHKFDLQNLHSDTFTTLQFYQDPELHNGEGKEGPSTQEVLRACIRRVQRLNDEKPWEGNAIIIRHLRCAIAGFEARAILRKIERDNFPIEELPVADNGHIFAEDI